MPDNDRSPWKPHGPVQSTDHSKWGDRERAAYIVDDIRVNGIREIDDDPWVKAFLVRLLWAEIERPGQSPTPRPTDSPPAGSSDWAAIPDTPDPSTTLTEARARIEG